ncbi:hypothetical protein MYP_640 [Sporocytophaga myxococcoides]|uniref:Uncharacterized protein n=1 Tax=Sporocytophaga myxococcoides TaxID=153721 RepID=A0A098LB57_9BACT|nr:hypothetical protein [Sporocytophaga myxococcoides]GAL83413.1 hypothetical protein MYP_640 [Sporocytophaga myxococcoides]
MGIAKNQADIGSNYQSLTDAAIIAINANSNFIRNYYLETARTAITVNFLNFRDGGVVGVKVKKQSASNLTFTVPTASIGIGNAVNNTIILTSPANSYFEIIIEARVVGVTPEYYIRVNPF